MTRLLCQNFLVMLGHKKSWQNYQCLVVTKKNKTSEHEFVK